MRSIFIRKCEQTKILNMSLISKKKWGVIEDWLCFDKEGILGYRTIVSIVSVERQEWQDMFLDVGVGY